MSNYCHVALVGLIPIVDVSEPVMSHKCLDILTHPLRLKVIPSFPIILFVSASWELVFLGCLLPGGKEGLLLLVHEIKPVLPFVNIGDYL